MVDTKTYTWDMAKISWPAIALLTTGDKVYLEKHGLESDPVVAKIPQQYMSPYGVGTNVYIDGARLSHRCVQGPQGAGVVGRSVEREGLSRPPRACASIPSTRSSRR